ncbi:hypothetical protein [Flavivirga spongiicola]|uniref:Nuclear transport factor 2 family protein n=1 Tax=Flavivirga spongiicola TaxID=421621 RepID=A0ABU7XUV9_9FLAO|nr:hypothetical protein [Flavivirga sp. MEBiC05379]MDO5978690.1 hypothetical protein [Flavivirga sp. MEBiC05379]
MKKLLIYILFLNSILVYAQQNKAYDNLRNDIKNSIKVHNESDYETVLKYFPDFIFENISKEEILKEISKNPRAKVREINKIKIDTIIKVLSIEYARFYIDSEIPTYGIKTKTNLNWTFIDQNGMTEKYIPTEIRKAE